MCPTSPFSVLSSVISHSDPFASATAVQAILGMEETKHDELYQLLMAQAIKNDGEMCWGHDILFVYESARCYKRSASPLRFLFPTVAGFLLGQAPKNYSLAVDYGV